MSQSPIYFTLGEAVSAIGLLFAVYQLRKPAWEIILSIRPLWQQRLYWDIGALAILLVTVAHLSRNVDLYVIGSISPFWYELTAFFLFIAAPIFMFVLCNESKGLFNTKSAEIFYQVILTEVARIRDETLNACVNIIGNNLRSISELAKRAISKDFPGINKEDNEQSTIIARSIFNVVLSDPRISDYIATARLDFLIHLLQEIKKNNLSKMEVGIGLEKIFERLFDNNRSHFYTQLEYGGFALSANIYESIFHDQYILERFDPLQEWNYWRHYDDKIVLEPKYLSLYLKALEKAIQGYWSDSKGYHNPHPINAGFTQLSQYAQIVTGYCVEDKSNGEYIKSVKQTLDRLGDVAHFIGHTFPLIYKEALGKGIIKGADLEVERQNSDGWKSLTAGFAELFYENMKTLARVKHNDEYVRQRMLDIGRYVFGKTADDKGEFNAIRSYVIDLIWKNVEESMNGFYPVVLRVYLPYICINVNGSEPNWLLEERKRVAEFLEKSLKPKILEGQKMADGKSMHEAFLPETIVFDKSLGSFKFAYSNGIRKPLEA